MNTEEQNPVEPLETVPDDGILQEEEQEQPAVQPPCGNHPEMVSITHCQVCDLPICATCAFTFAGDVVFCPACAQSPAVKQIDPKRIRNIRWALGLGIWALIGSIGFFVGATSLESEEEFGIIGLAYSVLVMFPNLAGLVIALTTREKRLADPPGTKAAIWLNSIVFGSFMLLIIVGNCMPS